MMQATNADQGLGSAAAAQALARDGHNELPSAKVQSAWMIAWRVMSEPMTLLLIACGLIYTLLGDWREALVLSIFVVVMIGISFYQEQKTEKALDALRELANPLAQVLREGKLLQIPSREVVRGDILFVYEGDRVAADAILIDGLNLKADESLLTG
jgi:Ca2+-transporting ATPase